MKTLKRQAIRMLSVILAVAMLVTVVPMMSFAVDNTPEYIYYGTYSGKPLKWQILEKTDGKMLLITDGVLAKATKFNETAAVVDFESSTINTVKLNGNAEGSFYYDSFSESERDMLIKHSSSFVCWVNNAKGTKTISTYVTLPSADDVTKYSLTKAVLDRTETNCNYWLADCRANSATDKCISIVTTTGSIVSTQQPTIPSNGYRAMIMLDAAGFVTFTKTAGITYTNTNGDEIANATLATAAKFKVVLGDSYNKSVITVKAGDDVLTADKDGIFTIPAGATDKTVTVEGVALNPADFTAYNAAVDATEALVETNYTADSWKVLADALAVDVSGFKADKQTEIDNAAAAINAAVVGLTPKGADFAAYDDAYDKANNIKSDSAHYSLNLIIPGTTQSYILMLAGVLNQYSKTNVYKYTILQQNEVDAATAALIEAAEMVPVKTASVNTWKSLVDEAAALDETKYMNVPDFQARVNAIVAEHDYVADPVDCFHQDEVDTSAARIKLIIDECKADSNFIPTDFTALGAALEKAATYLEENYYKDDEMEGGTIAWEELGLAVEKGNKYYEHQSDYNKKFRDQQEVDDATANLTQRMETLDEFIRLTQFQKFIKSIKDFFAKVQRYAKEGIAIMKTLNGLIKMLFNGEIDLYSLFEMIGVDQDFLDFLIKIGIKPALEPEPVPTPTPKA